MSRVPPRSDETTGERPPLADTLAALAKGPVRDEEVALLSDLDRSGSARLAVAWPRFPEETRLAIVRRVEELSEARLDLNFGRVLRTAVGDDSPTVRQLAVAALWEDERPDLANLLRERLRDDPSPDVRAAAAVVLGRVAERAAAGGVDEAVADDLREALYAVAADEAQPAFVRRRAIEAVGVFGQREEIRELIRAAFESDDDALQAGALYAMGASLDRRWFDVLLAATRSPDAEMRFEAARGCGLMGDDRAVPELVDLAQDEDTEVRHAAIAALGVLGSKASLRALRGLADGARESDAELIEAATEEAAALVDPLGVGG